MGPRAGGRQLTPAARRWGRGRSAHPQPLPVPLPARGPPRVALRGAGGAARPGPAALGGAGGPRRQPPSFQPQAPGPAAGAQVEAVDARALGPRVFGVEGDVRVRRGPGAVALGWGARAHHRRWQRALGGRGQPGRAWGQQEPASLCPAGSGHPGGGTGAGPVHPGRWQGALVAGRGAARCGRHAAGGGGHLRGRGSAPLRPGGSGQTGRPHNLGAGGRGGEGPGALGPHGFGRGALPAGSVDDVPGEPRLHLPAGPGVGVLPQRGQRPLAPRRGPGGALVQLGHRGRAGPAVQAALAPRRSGRPGGRGGEGRAPVLEGTESRLAAPPGWGRGQSMGVGEKG